MQLSNTRSLALSALIYTHFQDHTVETIENIINNSNNNVRVINGYKDANGNVNSYFQDLASMSSWTMIDCFSSSSSGFSGAAFQSPTGQIVFAFRGTDFNTSDITESLKDIREDVQLAIPGSPSGQPNQFHDASDFVKSTLEAVTSSTMTNQQVSNYISTNNVEFTGHSLGGGIVQYIIHTLDAGSGTTFNAVGVGQVLSGIGDPNSYAITDYVNENDVIGSYGMCLNLGNVSSVKINFKNNLFSLNTKRIVEA